MMKTKDLELRSAVTRALLRAGFPRNQIRHEITLDSYSYQGRADVVIANPDALFGVEIKSGSDTLTRMVDQSHQYGRCFDNTTLVIDKTHEPDVTTDPDRLWRVMKGFSSVVVFDAESGFRNVFGFEWQSHGLRDSPFELRKNVKELAGRSLSLSANAMLSLLWQKEIVGIGNELFPGRIPKNRCESIPILSELASLSQLRPLVAAGLQRRPLNKWELQFWKKFDEDTVK